jgi:sodium/hydrogen antiporter
VSPFLWFLLVGALLLLMVVLQSAVKRLPVSPAMIYLLLGLALGPEVLGLIDFDPFEHSRVLEHVTELAVLVSLFTVGLKIRLPLRERAWLLALRLAGLAMLLTIAPISALASLLFGLPLGAAMLLAAILAPTDPVLASDVQMRDAADRDRVRFGLTAEGALNDGMAFPFVMLGLGLLGLHDLGAGVRWLALDLAWAIGAGFASGWLCGHLAGRLVLYLRRTDPGAVGLDEFLALGLIALSYGIALALHAYGFLAVFAAGLAVRAVETLQTDAGQQHAQPAQTSGVRVKAAVAQLDAAKLPSRMMQALLSFNVQLEHLVEVAVVLLIGAMLRMAQLSWAALLLACLLLIAIRPAAVWLSLLGVTVPASQFRLIAWFGIRGVGSLYYLMFAINHGLPRELAEQLVALVLPVVAASILVHGVSATPLMERYRRKRLRSGV